MRRYYQRAFKDLWDNRFLTTITVITIALSVLIASTFALFYINAGSALNLWKKEIRMMAYLKVNASPAALDATRQRLEQISAIREIVFIPKQEALERLKQQLPGNTDIIDTLDTNPLTDAFEIVIDPEFSSSIRLATVAESVANLEAVAEVEYGQQWIQRFVNVIYLFSLAGYAMGALFFLATAFIVANTIRLVLYSRREEMEIMRLVGATDAFIKIPYYLQGMIQGALGVGIGLGLLYAGYFMLITRYTPSMSGAFFSLNFLNPELCAGILAGGILVGWLGCFVSLKQFMKV